jgi:hypothetical protein
LILHEIKQKVKIVPCYLRLFLDFLSCLHHLCFFSILPDLLLILLESQHPVVLYYSTKVIRVDPRFVISDSQTGQDIVVNVHAEGVFGFVKGEPIWDLIGNLTCSQLETSGQLSFIQDFWQFVNFQRSYGEAFRSCFVELNHYLLQLNLVLFQL